MRRAIKKCNPSKAIGITLATVILTGAFVCTGFIISLASAKDTAENKSTESIDKTSAPVHTDKEAVVEIKTLTEQTLNQQDNKEGISASKQSSLEKEIDTLIELTESDG